MQNLPQKSPALAAVLNFVRDTGQSAHPEPGQTVSDTVFAVALFMDLNPVALQAEVTAWADALAEHNPEA